MSLPFIFLLASLACFRLSRLISEDKIFESFRSFLVRKTPRSQKKNVEYGVGCPLCVSAEFSVAITIYLWLYLGLIPGAHAPLWCLAIWGGSIELNSLFVWLSK